jgi:hypothetical protein
MNEELESVMKLLKSREPANILLGMNLAKSAGLIDAIFNGKDYPAIDELTEKVGDPFVWKFWEYNVYFEFLWARIWDSEGYKSTSPYRRVENPELWEKCPGCKKIPIVWEFNNGRQTACGCGRNKYDHPSVHAESVLSVMKNSKTGTSSADYDTDGLRKNWNHWVETGEHLFSPSAYEETGRW